VTGTATYRGPLVGAPPAQLPPLPADGDVSLAAAFELGRLLGVADGRFTREIVAWHRSLDALARTMSSRQRVEAVLVGASAPRPAARLGTEADAGERFSVVVAAALRARAVAHPKADPWGVPAAARLLLDQEEPS
jgi:hypothetical protein